MKITLPALDPSSQTTSSAYGALYFPSPILSQLCTIDQFLKNFHTILHTNFSPTNNYWYWFSNRLIRIPIILVKKEIPS
jgi:hypothetical protein